MFLFGDVVLKTDLGRKTFFGSLGIALSLGGLDLLRS